MLGGQQSTQCCLCLLSPYPFFSLFFKVLFGVAVLWEEKRKAHTTNYALALKDKQLPLPTPLALSDFVAHFQTILSRLQQMRIPSMGGWSRMVLSPDITQLSFHRPHSESVAMERRTLLIEYAAPTLFALLSVDQVLFLLGCLCCEQKVLVVSDHVNIVSSCVLALITLLGPLQWAGPVITVLPPRLDELLEAPVPLIAGRVSINSASIPEFSTLVKPMKGVIEMNMDQNNLCMHSDDLMNYHELKLPGCDALVHELAYFASQLFAKHSDPEFPTVQQAEACDIICTRIHRHFDFLCSLALGENSKIGDVGVRRRCRLLPVFIFDDKYFAQV
uniref:UDENN domain-containing protein n=1 Tax=Globisporangium ultimum (strain ATCC 200006 / CBS 805.95 / DAOM BR144) TaxID=431595 RepID=K3WZS1_GLOUD